MICDTCDRDEEKVKLPSGSYNFIGDTCRTCYCNRLNKKKRDTLTNDPFNCLPQERQYYDDIGFDCQRNQDILLQGLHA